MRLFFSVREALVAIWLAMFFVGFGGIWLSIAATNAAADAILQVRHVVVCALNEQARWCGPRSGLLH